MDRIVSFSELDSYRQCPLKHQLMYKERWTEPTPSIALRTGSLMHAVLALHYQELQKWGHLDAAQVAVDESDLLQAQGDLTEEQDTVRWMYEGYCARYGGDPEWKVQAVEHRMEVPLGDVILKAIIDLVVEWHGDLWIVDHKTSKDLTRMLELDIDDQFGLYTYCLRQAGLPVKGAVHNGIRTAKLVRPMGPEERYVRHLTYRSDRELETIAEEASRTFGIAEREFGVAQEAGLDAVRSPNKDTCRWKCSFTEPCLAGRKGLDMREMLRDHGFRQDFTRH